MAYQRRAAICGAIVAAAALTVGWIGWHHNRFKHLAAHVPGRVYRSAYLEPEALSAVIHKYQIRTVVNLCDPGELGREREMQEQRVVAAAGARLVEIAMPSYFRLTDVRIFEHLAVLQDPDAYPLLVHCQHGVERTSQYLAMYDMVCRGMEPSDSLARQPLFGRGDHDEKVRKFLSEFKRHWKSTLSVADADRQRILAE